VIHRLPAGIRRMNSPAGASIVPLRDTVLPCGFLDMNHHSSESTIFELPENRFLTALDPDFSFVTVELAEKDLAKPDSPCRMMNLRLKIAAVSQ